MADSSGNSRTATTKNGVTQHRRSMSQTYVILDATEAENIDFNDVFEASAETIRWNRPDQEPRHAFVKFEGDTPSG